MIVLLDARWTPARNILRVRCTVCERDFDAPADRWRVRCPSCNKAESLRDIRERFAGSDA